MFIGSSTKLSVHGGDFNYCACSVNTRSSGDFDFWAPKIKDSLGHVDRDISRPHFGLLSHGEAVRDEPAQYISMQTPETTAVVPNGSHYRDSQ